LVPIPWVLTLLVRTLLAHHLAHHLAGAHRFAFWVVNILLELTLLDTMFGHVTQVEFLLLVRSVREDRTVLAAQRCVYKMCTRLSNTKYRTIIS
jgi:hypothetical protein